MRRMCNHACPTLVAPQASFPSFLPNVTLEDPLPLALRHAFLAEDVLRRLLGLVGARGVATIVPVAVVVAHLLLLVL